MNVAQTLDFLSGQPLVHEGLLHFSDLCGLHPLAQFPESFFKDFHVFSVVEIPDDSFEYLLLFNGISWGFVHGGRRRFIGTCVSNGLFIDLCGQG